MAITKSQADQLAPGSAFEGGFYGGLIAVGAGLRAVVWAPKTSEVTGVILPSGVVAVAYDYADSSANTEALFEAGSELAQAAKASTVGGFDDWLLPARDVLEMGYRLLKPSTRDNYWSGRDGENVNSVPEGGHYTASIPGQTSAVDFKEGGAQAFDQRWYMSGSITAQGHVWGQGMDNGRQSLIDCGDFVGVARFVRLMLIAG